MTPVTGTVPGTGARGMVYGRMLRCVTMEENQDTLCTTVSGRHAAARTTTVHNARLPTPHLFGAATPEQRLDRAHLGRLGRHEDAELVVREARVVGDRTAVARGEDRVEDHAEQGGERPEENGHLEHDDDVGGNRADGLAADLNRPVVRHEQREPGPDGAA